MALFYDVAAALTEPVLDKALEQTLRLVAEHLRLDAAWVWLLDEDTNQFYLAASYDLPPYLREPMHMTGEPCWCMQAFFDGDFVSQNVDIIACSRLREGIDEAGEGATRGLRSHASIALRFGDRELGLINAARAQSALSPEELQTLVTIGAQVGVAVERSRLAERAAVAARVEERSALARELHDTIVQDLTAITLQLESAGRKIESEPAKAQERVSTAVSLARNALEELRRNVEGLRGDPLAGETLIRAISRLGRKFTSQTGVQLAIEAPDELPPLRPEAEVAIFRIISEALSNIERHADARHVQIAIDADSQGVKVSIEDDGRGFETGAASSGFGITGMRERVEELRGTFALRSSEMSGTGVFVELPAAE